MRPHKMIRLYAFALLAISPGLLVWQHYGMNRVLRIDGNSSYRIDLVDDRGSGGKTTSTLTREGGRLILDSQIAEGFAWPFAEIDISLAKAPASVNLSGYDELHTQIEYQSPGSRQVRLFLRNYDPAYSKVDDTTTWKLNQVDFVPKAGGELKILPLRNFTVTTWWIADHKIPVEHAGQDLRHIPLIGISTPGTLEPGHHRIIIDYLEFRGKWATREQVALGLAGLWMISTLLFLAIDLRQARRKLRQSFRREKDLQELTRALKLENKSIGDMARRDPLTGIRNRAGILDELFYEAEKAHLTKEPLAILFADADHFKAVNDQFGHDVGDQVLAQIAREMDRMVRRSDYLVRWGGEEFVLLCPSTDLFAAERLADKIRQQIESCTWPQGLKITISLGVTTLGREPIPEALKRADRALYDAKKQGRNRVIVLPSWNPDQGDPDTQA